MDTTWVTTHEPADAAKIDRAISSDRAAGKASGDNTIVLTHQSTRGKMSPIDVHDLQSQIGDHGFRAGSPEQAQTAIPMDGEMRDDMPVPIEHTRE